MKLPILQLKERPLVPQVESALLAEGYDPLVARLFAARLDANDASRFIAPTLRTLDPPDNLPDILPAARRICQALKQQEVIGIETDYDCDGQTAHAVMYHCFIHHFGHPKHLLRSYIGRRLEEGYGLSVGLTQRILSDELLPTVLITADNGSSDEAQIATLKAQGIDVIVTDHHEIPKEGIPKSAYAVINPTREDNSYPDRWVAGCMVAWLLMAMVRKLWSQETGRALPTLADCLDFVAVGTIADCVSMAKSHNNRAVVRYGMRLIEKKTRPCWRALRDSLFPITSEAIAFQIAPLLNSDGRLATALPSVSFLTAQTEEEAIAWMNHLQNQNQQRKEIQNYLIKSALEKACEAYQAGKKGLCLFLEDGHVGVQGIVASRLKESFGRPTFVFSSHTSEKSLLVGSGRSIAGLHLRDVLQKISQNQPGLLRAFGGHEGACGVTIEASLFQAFSSAFEKTIEESFSGTIGPILWTDGVFSDQWTLPQLEKLQDLLEPLGKGFEAPIFEAEAHVLSWKPIGQEKTHAQLRLALYGQSLEAVWFHCRQKEENWPITVGKRVKIAYTPRLQTFRGEKRLQCQVFYLTGISDEVKYHVGGSGGDNLSTNETESPLCPLPGT